MLDYGLSSHSDGYIVSNYDAVVIAATAFSGLPFAIRHWELSNKPELSTFSLVHKVIAVVEALPFGVLIVLIERIVTYIQDRFPSPVVPLNNSQNVPLPIQKVNPPIQELRPVKSSRIDKIIDKKDQGKLTQSFAVPLREEIEVKKSIDLKPHAGLEQISRVLKDDIIKSKHFSTDDIEDKKSPTVLPKSETTLRRRSTPLAFYDVETQKESYFQQVAGHKKKFKSLPNNIIEKETEQGEGDAYKLLHAEDDFLPLRKWIAAFHRSEEKGKEYYIQIENFLGGFSTRTLEPFILDIKLGKAIFDQMVYFFRQRKAGVSDDMIISAKKTIKMNVADLLSKGSFKVQQGDGKLMRAMNVFMSSSTINKGIKKYDIAIIESLLSQLTELKEALDKSPIAFYGASVLIVIGLDKETEKMKAIARWIDIGHYVTMDEVISEPIEPVANAKGIGHSYATLRKNVDEGLAELIGLIKNIASKKQRKSLFQK